MNAWDWTWRWVPRHHWVRIVVSVDRDTEPGHQWLYYGVVRRDAWRLGRLVLAMLRLPRAW